jgi:UDP-N-acetylmuramoylalanine--D-glutamate ligase
VIDLIKGKEVLVVGMARSGMAAVETLAGAGAAKITVTDHKQPAELQAELAKLARLPAVQTVTGGNPPDLVNTSLSLIVKSPGVPPKLELFRRAAELQIPVISEIELAYAFIKTPIIGITGTNGKTTTTALVAAMLKEARFAPVTTAGNIGDPLSGPAGKISAQGFIVAELSSFQLENINLFRPVVAVFLNFAPDHIDYHSSLEKYFAAKTRIFENQGVGDYAVLNAADSAIADLAPSIKARVIWFDRVPVSLGVGLENDWLTLYNPGCSPQPICPREELMLPGEHNLENALAAAAAAWAAGADLTSIGRVLRSFRAIEHRLEHVAAIGGVDYINDSKGTNPGATVKALQSFPGRKKILIAGGKDKGGDFSELAVLIKNEVRLLLLIGETKDQLSKDVAAAGFTDYRTFQTMEEAVIDASKAAEPGDLVLLSPACASWDMFTDYEARGNLFKQLVRDLSTAINDGKEHGDG